MSNLVHNKRCPLCGFKGFREVYREDYKSKAMRSYLLKSYSVDASEIDKRLNGESFILHLCHNCRLIYQCAVPDNDLQSLLYDRWISADRSYAKYLDRMKDVPFLSSVEDGISAGIKLVEKEPSRITALDFGAGWGIASDILRQLVGECLVGEISPRRVAALTKRGHACVDINDIPDASVDYIYTEQVLEHLVNVGEWLNLFSRKLVVGGVLRIGVPNGAGITAILGKRPWLPAKPKRWSLNPIAPLEHVNCFNASTMNKACKIFGLAHMSDRRLAGPSVTRLLRSASPNFQSLFDGATFRLIGKKLPLEQYFRKTRVHL